MYLRLFQAHLVNKLYLLNSIMLHVADRTLVVMSNVLDNQGLNISQRFTKYVAVRMDLEMDGTKARLQKAAVTGAAQTSMLGAEIRQELVSLGLLMMEQWSYVLVWVDASVQGKSYLTIAQLSLVAHLIIGTSGPVPRLISKEDCT